MALADDMNHSEISDTAVFNEIDWRMTDNIQ